MQGTIIRSTGLFYKVHTENGEIVDATLRGKFRLKNSDRTNPIAVGDRVNLINEGHNYVINTMFERHNYVLRKSTRAHSQTQVLCANIDQAIILVTLKEPFTPLTFVDSFLVMNEAYHIPTIVIFNKVDLLTKENEIDKLLDFVETYQNVSQTVLTICAKKEIYRSQIATILQNKITFISGVSGSGKSTLINMIDKNLYLKTNEVSNHNGKGKHTTTFAEMHALAIGGFIIDAPGFNEFEVTGIKKEELSQYYVDMKPYLQRCKFNNCLHVSEPQCAVIKAVESGIISLSRYNTYLNILGSL